MNMQLHQGDCLEVMRSIPDGSVDAIICDPPFATTQLYWDQRLDWEAIWTEYHRITKKNSPIILFAAQPFTSELISSNRKNWRHNFYWVKSKASCYLLANHQPMKKVEEIVVFARGRVEYHPPLVPLEKPYTEKRTGRKKSQVYGGGNVVVKDEYIEYTHKTQTDVLEFPSLGKRERLMNTQKPLELVKFFVETYTKPGDWIADTCMGAGTTGVACKDLNRNFIGIEKDQKHFLIASNRINDIPQTHNATVDAAPHRHVDVALRDAVNDNYPSILRAYSTLPFQRIHELLCQSTGIQCKPIALHNHFLSVVNLRGDNDKLKASA